MEKQDNMLISRLNNNKWLIWLLIFLITIIWGYAWVLMKEALQYMGPFTFSAFRFGTGSITLLIVVWFLKIKPPPKDQWKYLFIVGLLQTSVVFLLVMYGLQFVNAGKSSVLLYSMPIWSSFLAAKILKEKVTPVKAAGLLIGMVGLLMILGWDIWYGQNVKTIVGELLIVLAAVSWGASNVYYRLKLSGMNRLQVNTYQMVFGTIGIIIAAVVMEWGDPVVLNLHCVYYILFTGILASALCFTLWFVLLSVIDMVTATISMLLVPVFGLILSALIIDEKITFGIIAGSVFIIAGIMIAQVKQKSGSEDRDSSKAVQ